MHSRNAVGSPRSASSTALRVNASASPPSNAAAAIVVLLRQATGGRRDCPTGPFQTAARAPAPALLVQVHQSSASPWSNGRAIPAGVLDREYACQFGNF